MNQNFFPKDSKNATRFEIRPLGTELWLCKHLLYRAFTKNEKYHKLFNYFLVTYFLRKRIHCQEHIKVEHFSHFASVVLLLSKRKELNTKNKMCYDKYRELQDKPKPLLKQIQKAKSLREEIQEACQILETIQEDEPIPSAPPLPSIEEVPEENGLEEADVMWTLEDVNHWLLTNQLTILLSLSDGQTITVQPLSWYLKGNDEMTTKEPIQQVQYPRKVKKFRPIKWLKKMFQAKSKSNSVTAFQCYSPYPC